MKRQKSLFILAILLLGSILKLSAQPQAQALPIDPKVKYGTLENGLTYYIRHNELPKNRAEFFIVQKVGSVLEEDNQAGLAHFLEHMAFNGTKNLPGKMMINYLETIGVKFGENLNAYTAFDETVYNISNVPLMREGVVDTCLLVLHDWSGFLTLGDDEITKERGVIREEMRTRNNAGFRQIEKLLPQIMPGSQYAKRLPIGTEEVVMNFKSQELRDYYHKWYRPDLQGIIIVGDIDVDQVEAKIKKLFADIPKPVNPATRIYYPVPDNEEPLLGLVTDKEATNTQVCVYYKHDPLPRELRATIAGLANDYVTQVSTGMLNSRFSEIVQKANPPFIYASSEDGEFLVAQTKDAWTVFGMAEENQIEKTLNAITEETERVRRYGFTASEYERTKINILKSYENAFNERDKQQNVRYAREYANHFSKGGYIPGIEMEYNMVNQIASAITVEQINQGIKQLIGQKNIVLSITGPEKEGLVYPTKEQAIAWFESAEKKELKPYEDKISNEPLMTTLPKPGAIKTTTKDVKFGTVDYTLSNGVKVIIKPTTFKDDEILLAATSPGGSSHFPESESANIKLYGSVINLGGVSNFSNIDLSKILAGKRASVEPTIGITNEGFSGYSNQKDFETLLQLLYLKFTAPRMDEEAYQSFISRTKSQLESREIEPSIALFDTINVALYKSSARTGRLKPGDIAQVNYQTIMNWYKDRYKDASDFTFVFVGNINPDSVKPMIEKYLGSLPSINRKEVAKPVDLSFKKGLYKNSFDKEMQNPTATVFDAYSGVIEPTLSNKIKMNMLSQILRIVYTEKVREDEGGTYGVSVSGSISDYPKGQSIIQMSFDTNAEKKDFLNGIIIKEFQNMAAEGPRQEDFSKVKEFMLKKQKENEQENGYWRGVILNFYQTGYDGNTNYSSILEAIAPGDIKRFAQQLLDQKNSIVVIMNGVNQSK